MNFDGIVHRTFDGGVAPLNVDLNVNKLGKIGSFKKEELYSANAFEVIPAPSYTIPSISTPPIPSPP